MRLGREGALKAGNQLVVATEVEGDVNALGPGGAPFVVEPRRREAGVRLEGDIGQCIPPPKAERFVECLERLVQLVPGHRGPCSVEISMKRAASTSHASRSTSTRVHG